ncbi:tetratricopeptide repeat protein, partial [Streptomyces sp. SID8358]
ALGESAEARRMHEDTLARRRRVLGEDHPDTLVSFNSVAVILHSLRLYPEAVELLQDARARFLRVHGVHHPDTTQITRNLAASLRAMGRRHEAEQLMGRKASKGKRRFGRKRR